MKVYQIISNLKKIGGPIATYYVNKLNKKVTPSMVKQAVQFVTETTTSGANPFTTPPHVSKKRAKRRRDWGISNAKYVGRFKKPKKMKRKKSVEQKSLQKGYHKTEEQWGYVTDPHCAYITHSTYMYDTFARCIAGAILRRLFENAGVKLSSKTQVMQLFSGSQTSDISPNGVEYWITVERTNPNTNTQTLGNHILMQDDSLERLVSGSTGNNQCLVLIDAIKAYLDTSVTQWEINKIYLTRIPQGVGAAPQEVIATLDLREVHINLYSSSHLKVQNRTKGDLAGEGVDDADRVDNQPLSGKIYSFKHGEPRLRTQFFYSLDANNSFNLATNPERYVVGLNSVSDSGINLIKSSDVKFDQFREPPNPRFFSNCNKVSSIKLNPGDIKDCYITWKTSGKLMNVMKRLRVGARSSGQNAQLIGKCQTLVMEELLRTDSGNPIVMQYERQNKVGCFIGVKKERPYFLTELASTQLNAS